jgi:hypothetical protein
MPKVRFLQDFRGKETREVFYLKGQEVELDGGMAERLLADRRVELVAKMETPADFLEPVVFENVTDVDVHKPGGEVKIVNSYFDNTPQFEQAEEPPRPEPKPKRKGRR